MAIIDPNDNTTYAVTNRETLSPTEQARRKMVRDFKECFTTEAGQNVLKALKSEYYDGYIGRTTGEEAIRFLGQRDVLHHIIDIVEN